MDNLPAQTSSTDSHRDPAILACLRLLYWIYTPDLRHLQRPNGNAPFAYDMCHDPGLLHLVVTDDEAIEPCLDNLIIDDYFRSDGNNWKRLVQFLQDNVVGTTRYAHVSLASTLDPPIPKTDSERQEAQTRLLRRAASISLQMTDPVSANADRAYTSLPHSYLDRLSEYIWECMKRGLWGVPQTRMCKPLVQQIANKLEIVFPVCRNEDFCLYCLENLEEWLAEDALSNTNGEGQLAIDPPQCRSLQYTQLPIGGAASRCKRILDFTSRNPRSATTGMSPVHHLVDATPDGDFDLLSDPIPPYKDEQILADASMNSIHNGVPPEPAPIRPGPPPDTTPWSTYDLLTRATSVEYLIEDILCAGEPMIIAGPPKSLKTTFACMIAVSLATGRPFLGRYSVNRPQKVLLASMESGKDVISQIIAGALQFHGMDYRSWRYAENLRYLWALPDNPSAWQEFRDTLDRVRPNVVILDPMYMIITADPSNVNDCGQWIKWIADFVKSAGATPIFIDHTRKPPAQRSNSRKTLTLYDITGAGKAEVARQWIILDSLKGGEVFKISGEMRHCISMSAGGSAGHSLYVRMNITECPALQKNAFTDLPPVTNRRYKMEFDTESLTAEPTSKRSKSVDDLEEQLVDAMRQEYKKSSKMWFSQNNLRELSSLSVKNVKKSLNALVKEEVIATRDGKQKKKNSDEYHSEYALKEFAEDSAASGQEDNSDG